MSTSVLLLVFSLKLAESGNRFSVLDYSGDEEPGGHKVMLSSVANDNNW